MASPLLLTASRAARRAAVNGGAVLDVLAPAVYARSTATLRPNSTSAPSDGNEPSPPQRPLNAAASSRRRPPASQTKPDAALSSSSPKPPPAPRKRRTRPPVLETEPSAVSLLSQIRKSAPVASSPARQSQASSSHNLAVLSLTRGTRDEYDLNYQHAFQQGWTALRRSGQVGRVPAESIARVLLAAMKATRENPDRIRVDWKKIRELILWLCGEPETVRSVVADWAWESVASGREGCVRVIEIFEALKRDEHKTLRKGPRSPDYASKAETPFSISKPKEHKMTSWLFSASIASKAILRSQDASPPTFASLLPDYLDRSLPRLEPLLKHSAFPRHLDKYILTRKAYDDPAHLRQLVLSSVRQVSLAQQWYLRRDVPGIGVWTRISRHFRAGELDAAWALWQTLQEAVDSGEVGWISVEEWDASARERWISKEIEEEMEKRDQPGSGAEAEAEPAAVSPPLSDPSLDDPSSLPLESPALSSSLSDLSLSPEPAPTAAASTSSPALPPAAFHQALVAKLLSGFALSRRFEHAQAIWSWLSTRTPPLTPGIVCWTGLLNGYARRGDVAAVEQVFADMKAAQVEPDLWAWVDRITAHFEARLTDEAVKLVEAMKRDPAVLRHVGKDFNGKIPEPAYNAIIGGLLSNGRKVEAEAMLAEMDKTGTPPSTYTLNSFIKLCARGSKPDLAATARLIAMAAERGLEVNVYTFTMVLLALMRAGHKDAANKTIAIMEASNVKPTAVTYGALLAALAQTGQAEHLAAAVQLLDEMESKRIQTNEIHYTAVMQGFLNAANVASSASGAPSPQANLESALTLKKRMERRNLSLNRIGYNALLSYSLALKSPEGVELALSLLREMNQRLATRLTAPPPVGAADGGEGGDYALPLPSTDAHGRHATVGDTWYILLQGFARMHDWPRAQAVVMEMKRSGFEVRNKGLAKLVKHVTRREYADMGSF
ncbi:hypothetical protein JCM6882_003610 [Rhodosporidiobolus microsporus]